MIPERKVRKESDRYGILFDVATGVAAAAVFLVFALLLPLG